MSIPAKQLVKHLIPIESILSLDLSYNARLLRKEPKKKYLVRLLREVVLGKGRRS
jgi:hypothetical protein